MEILRTEKEKLVLKLAYCQGIGLVGKERILSYVKSLDSTSFSVDELIQMAGLTRTKEQFRSDFMNLTEDRLDFLLKDQSYMTIFDEKYPSYLKEILYPPQVIFYQGKIEWLNDPKIIGFVGAREATAYAKRVVHDFLPALVNQNIVIISGLAKGVDQWSHAQTIALGGRTIGVVASGLDICYPRESFPIFSDMKKNHLVISEFPRGTPPLKHHFPMRNRIIAALSDGVCVIEAKERSGALITAQLAMEYGKDVFAVPGEVLSGQSEGCHQLIQDGAICTTKSQRILEEASFFRVI